MTEDLSHIHAITLTVPAEFAGQPLMHLVQAAVGVEIAGELFAHGGVWLERRRLLDPDMPAPIGAQVRLRRPPDGCYNTLTITPDDICYEDAWLLALNKRLGWYTGPTPWDTEGNMRVALHRMLTARDGVEPRLHLAHQLDRDTSGVLLCTLDPRANAPLQRAFADHTVDKTYSGICRGEPSEETYEMRTGHGRARGGCWRLYPLEQAGTELPGGGRVRLAHTTFQVAQRLGDCAVIRAFPHTGRTHQIRLHLARWGHPLLGDTRYGGPLEFRNRMLPGHLLHAARLALRHPITGQPLEIHAPLPDLFTAIIGQ